MPRSDKEKLFGLWEKNAKWVMSPTQNTGIPQNDFSKGQTASEN